jgi:hypothetical protein
MSTGSFALGGQIVKLFVSLLLVGICVMATPSDAAAHMKLLFPADRIMTNDRGDPQKGTANCAAGPRTNMRTVLKAGATIMLEWTETVSHPGHFRIAFDDDGEDAFRDPDGINVMNPPVMPVLADGLFRDGHMSGRRLMHPLKLPNVVCKNCTLQILQIMTDNEDVIYRHCADIELTMDGGSDGGAPGPRDGGSRVDGPPAPRPDAGGRRDGGRPPDARPPVGGTGGSAGTGGASGAGGGYAGTGGASGSAGSSPAPAAGSGGARPGGAAGASAGAPAPTPPSNSDSGGFCSIGGRDQRPVFALAFVGLVGAFLWRARRRRNR